MSILEAGFLGLLMSISTTIFAYIHCRKYYYAVATFSDVFSTAISAWWIMYLKYAIVFAVIIYFPFYPWWVIPALLVYVYFDYWAIFKLY